MERIMIFGFAGIMIVLIVGFAFVVGALRNLVMAVLSLNEQESAQDRDTKEFAHEIAGLINLRMKEMISEEEYERRKLDLLKKHDRL